MEKKSSVPILRQTIPLIVQTRYSYRPSTLVIAWQIMSDSHCTIFPSLTGQQPLLPLDLSQFDLQVFRDRGPNVHALKPLLQLSFLDVELRQPRQLLLPEEQHAHEQSLPLARDQRQLVAEVLGDARCVNGGVGRVRREYRHLLQLLVDVTRSVDRF